jgi:hypothetical protein
MIRTRGILALLCLLLAAGTVLAEKPRNGMSVYFNYYSDNGNNRVIAPAVTLSKKLTDTYYLGASAGLDAISSATKNAQAAQQSSGEDDEEEGGDNYSYRYPVSLSVTYDKDDDTLTAGGYYSYESTYIGRSVFGSYTRRLNLNNTVLGIAYSKSFDHWVPDRVLPTDRRSEQTMDLSLTQLLSPRRSVQFTYSALRSVGFLAQPTDSVVPAGSTTPIYAQYPDQRTGSAYAIRFVTLVTEPTSLHIEYRYYRDDWHIRSHTTNVELYRDVSPAATLGIRYRYYEQTRASFAKDLDQYTPNDPLVAVDYRMYAFHSNTAGVMAILTPSKTFLRGSDPDKVKVKLSADIFTTSSQPNIQYQYKTDRLTGTFFTFGLDYNF